MNWRASLSDEEAKEIYTDSCAAYQADQISFNEFVLALSKLGYNATDIADAEKFYRPAPAGDTDDLEAD